MTLDEFRDVLFKYAILTPVAVENFYSEIVALFNKPEPVNVFIATYCEHYKMRYGHNPIIGRGKGAGTAKRLVKDYGLTKVCDLVKTYLDMNDAEFISKAHDIQTFEFRIQKVLLKHETGRAPGRIQAQQAENVDANMQAMQEWRARKGKS